MKTTPWMKTLGASALVVISLAAYKALEIKAAIAMGEAYPEHSETVSAITVGSQSHQDSVKVLGEILAPQQVTLRTEMVGRIVEIGFRSGDTVAEGQLLLQQDISEERAQLSSAKARFDLASRIHQRNLKLRKSNSVSQEQLDKAKADLATVDAEISVLNSAIRKKTIRAPFAGMTDIHQFEVGELLMDNQAVTNLVGLQDELWVDFQVPQFYPTLAIGSHVRVQRIAHRKQASSSWVSAEVIARNTQVSSDQRSLQYRALLKRDGFAAAINAGVSVSVPVGEDQTYPAVPLTAVQRDHLGPHVFILQQDKTSAAYRAVRQEVTIAARQQDQLLIAQGLSVGQLIAGPGAFKLYPGLLVRINSNDKSHKSNETTQPLSAQLTESDT